MAVGAAAATKSKSQVCGAPCSPQGLHAAGCTLPCAGVSYLPLGLVVPRPPARHVRPVVEAGHRRLQHADRSERRSVREPLPIVAPVPHRRPLDGVDDEHARRAVAWHLGRHGVLLRARAQVEHLERRLAHALPHRVALASVGRHAHGRAAALKVSWQRRHVHADASPAHRAKVGAGVCAARHAAGERPSPELERAACERCGVDGGAERGAGAHPRAKAGGVRAGNAPARERDVAGRVGEVATPAALARLLEARPVLRPIGDELAGRLPLQEANILDRHGRQHTRREQAEQRVDPQHAIVLHLADPRHARPRRESVLVPHVNLLGAKALVAVGRVDDREVGVLRVLDTQGGELRLGA
eukprot:5157097-Prymnesium_polylepis.1